MLAHGSSCTPRLRRETLAPGSVGAGGCNSPRPPDTTLRHGAADHPPTDRWNVDQTARKRPQTVTG